MSEQSTWTRRSPAARCGASVLELTEGVFAELVRLARPWSPSSTCRPGRRSSSTRYWKAVEPPCPLCCAREPLLTGAGLAVWPAGRPTPPRSSGPSAWWVLRDGEVRRKQHVLNPRSDSFYEVTEARWFRVPHRTGQPALLSPYVDSWGTDDVTMTAAVPLSPGRDVLGVVAADLDVRVLPGGPREILVAADATAVLDEDDRVIASTWPRLEVGVRLAATGIDGVRERVEIVEFGWSLVRLRGTEDAPTDVRTGRGAR